MIELQADGYHLPDGLVTWSPSKHAKKLVQCSEEVIVRDVVLTPREP
jgi:hypothetical protein